jgi:hypothetical protein
MPWSEVEDFIARAHWQSAKSTEDVAPHQYVVLGWDRDDITDAEFWSFASLIKAEGRLEEWTPPPEWVRRWGGKPMTNRYLYIGDFAYWFTWPKRSVPMLNREHVSVQESTPTRMPVPERKRFEDEEELNAGLGGGNE